jgi:excinuclease ABC subunit A
VIDLGTEGGAGGGRIIGAGTPEEVARIETSATGRFLSDLLFRADQPPFQSVAG